MTTTPVQPPSRDQHTEGHAGTIFPSDQINEPGCYVCQWSGHLLRIPENAIAPGGSPVLNMVGKDRMFVTKINDNPYIPVTKARLEAADRDVNVNF